MAAAPLPPSLVERAVAEQRERRLAPAPSWPAKIIADAGGTRRALGDAHQMVVRLADAAAAEAEAADALEGGCALAEEGCALAAAVEHRDAAKAAHVRKLRRQAREASCRGTSARLAEVRGLARFPLLLRYPASLAPLPTAC